MSKFVRDIDGAYFRKSDINYVGIIIHDEGFRVMAENREKRFYVAERIDSRKDAEKEMDDFITQLEIE